MMTQGTRVGLRWFGCLLALWLAQGAGAGELRVWDDQRLGGGVYGTVYKVMANDGKFYAIKVFNPIPSHDPKLTAEQALQAEIDREKKAIRLIEQCNDDGCVRCYGFDNFCLYSSTKRMRIKSGQGIRFELMDGTWERFIKKRSLRDRDRLYHVVDIAKTLNHLHKEGVTHSDIKSDNIFVKGFVSKLGDFGLVNGRSDRTTYGFSYMYPCERCEDAKDLAVNSDNRRVIDTFEFMVAVMGFFWPGEMEAQGTVNRHMNTKGRGFSHEVRQLIVQNCSALDRFGLAKKSSHYSDSQQDIGIRQGVLNIFMKFADIRYQPGEHDPSQYYTMQNVLDDFSALL